MQLSHLRTEAWPLCEQNLLSSIPLILDWKHPNKCRRRIWIFSCLSIIFQFFRSKENKIFHSGDHRIFCYFLLLLNLPILILSVSWRATAYSAIWKMQLKRASGYLHYIDHNWRIPYYYNVPPHLLFYSTIHYNHQLRKKKTVILGTYCDTRLKCLSNSPIYTCGRNLWWWQKWKSFTINHNREVEKYKLKNGSLLTPKIDINPTKTDWNFDGEAGAHKDHIYTGLQD